MRQIKVNISDETHSRLVEAKDRFKKRAPATVAAEVIDRFLYLWVASEEKKEREIERRLRRELKKISPEYDDKEKVEY